jgi:proline iminopeptidase
VIRPFARANAVILGIALTILFGVCNSARSEDGRVPRDGFDLCYRTVGVGEPLVLLSGGPGIDASFLDPVADELGHNFECILLEQRGTGRSRLKTYTPATVSLSLYVDDLEALREHLKLDKLTLLGNSWGMMLALAYASAHPDRVRAIVTMGSGPVSYDYFTVFNDNIRSRLWPSDLAASHRAVRVHDKNVAAFDALRAILPGYFYDHDRGERYAGALAMNGFNSAVGPPVMGALFRARFDLRPGLHRITAPVLLLQGRQDPAGEANLYEAHLAIAGSRIQFLEKCGHLPWVEQPDRFYRACRQFLTEALHRPTSPLESSATAKIDARRPAGGNSGVHAL